MKRFFVFFLVLSLFFISADANSAQFWWEGADSTGIITDGDSPIEVIHENLKIEIADLPDEEYLSGNQDTLYNSKATAEYTFLNPEDFTITARLMFPYGLKPDYVNNDNQLPFIQIFVDGNPIEYQLRHTYSSNLSEFSLETNLNQLYDSFKTHEFYTPDLTVTEITVQVTELDDETYPNATLDFTFDKINASTKVYLPYADGIDTNDTQVSIRKGVQQDNQITLFFFGEYDSHLIQPVFYSNGGCTTIIDGKAEIISTETASLYDFIMARYPKQSSILEHDWYNAFLDMIASNTFVVTIDPYISMDGSLSLLQWIDYSIKIDAQSTLVNSIAAPIYPDINMSYESPVYSFTYLLSPAKSWRNFKNLNIEIHTELILNNSSLKGFEKTDFGYQYFTEALPDTELDFDLCAVQNPKKDRSLSYYLSYSIPMFLFTAILQAIPIVFIGLFILFFYKSRIER